MGPSVSSGGRAARGADSPSKDSMNTIQTPVSTRIAIVGAGSMGSGLAALFARQGFAVALIDPVDGALARADAAITRQLTAVGAEVAAVRARIAPSPELAAAASADLVIEAAPERLELKQRLFAELDALCPPHTVFATNTSGLSINAIAQAVARRDRFVGAHFFTPADVIPLVEVVRGDATSDATIDFVMTTLRAAGKRPVLVRRDIPGFIANRIQHALAREAIALLEQGVASAADIDEVVRWSLGIRLALTGPLEQRDLNGIDVHHAIASYLYADLENRSTPAPLMAAMVERGDIGAKSGRGFYDWPPERRERVQADKARALAELAAWLQRREQDAA